MPDEVNEQRITIFLIAASPVVRQGILSAIAKNKDMEVVGQVGSSDESFSITGDIKPRTVALLSLTPKSSFQIVYQLKEVSPDITVIVLAEYYDDDSLFQAILAGASAFITTRSTSKELMETIRRVYRGERLVVQDVLSRPRVSWRVLERFRELSQVAKTLGPLLSPLSPTEEKILNRIAADDPVEAITTFLNTSQQEIETRIESALRKLDINERTIEVIRKLRRGFGERPPFDTKNYSSS